MPFGLRLSDPSRDTALRQRVSALLTARTIPFEGFTDEPAPFFDGVDSLPGFLRRFAEAMFRPGTPAPAVMTEAYLSPREALPGDVMRQYVLLHLNLLPLLRVDAEVFPLEGGFHLGGKLLIAPVSTADVVDVLLPDGLWTDMVDGAVYPGGRRLRLMRGYNAMPVLARANALIPIGVEDRRTDGDDADRLTLHWYQPSASAQCRLRSGESYRAEAMAGSYRLRTDSAKPCHLVVHEDGEERLIP